MPLGGIVIKREKILKVYKTKLFNKWTKTNKITEEALRDGVSEICLGLVDAQLGGCLYKKRLELVNKGKRGGARVILVYRKEDRLIFLYGFAKNEKDNVTSKEKGALKKLADFYLKLSNAELNNAVKTKELVEVKL